MEFIIKKTSFGKTVNAANDNKILKRWAPTMNKKDLKERAIFFSKWILTSPSYKYTRIYLDNKFVGGSISVKKYLDREEWFNHWEKINQLNKKYFSTEEYKLLNGDDKTDINAWAEEYKNILKDK